MISVKLEEKGAELLEANSNPKLLSLKIAAYLEPSLQVSLGCCICIEQPSDSD